MARPAKKGLLANTLPRADIDRVRFLALTFICACIYGCTPTMQLSGPPLAFRAVLGPAIIAHQSGALEAPENTLVGVKHSVDSGADWVEVSATLSADDRVVVIGELSLERTTNGKGLVRSKRLRELKALSASSPKLSSEQREALGTMGLPSPDFTRGGHFEPIPTLAEVFEATEGRILVRLEPGVHKRRLARGVVDSIVRARADDRVALCSSDLELLERASARHGGLPLFAIVDSMSSLEAALVLSLQGVVVTSDFFETAMRTVPMGMAVWVGPLRERESIERVALAGGHGILTDLPKTVVKYLRPPVELHIRRPHEQP